VDHIAARGENIRSPVTIAVADTEPVSPSDIAPSSAAPSPWLAAIATPRRRDRLVHTHVHAERLAEFANWPSEMHSDVVAAIREAGMARPWRHQAEFAAHALAGRDAIIATGTASGKSLAYWAPAWSALLADPDSRSTVLHLSPTKALTSDQFRAMEALAPEGVRPATYDGDTGQDERRWARQHARYLLTNPDMLHHGILPGHAHWARVLRDLQFVVIDETHALRGVFGAHIALVLRRLQRLCAHYGSRPTFLMASATMADPATTASRLIGREVVAVTDDCSPRATRTFALWEPPLLAGRTSSKEPGVDDADAQVDTEPADERAGIALPTDRRSAIAEAADLLADLVVAGAQTLTFVRSRRGAEAVASQTRAHLDHIDPGMVDEVAAYRGGYLPEERRELEEALRSRRLRGLATTNALELGIDVSGLDAVLIAGWPGTVASVRQQAGRAGRAGQDALAVLVARDDPLDQFVLQHPDVLFGAPSEATVFDPANPYVLAPHLAAAASELPLTEDGAGAIDVFGDSARDVAQLLVARGLLRRRPAGWFWTSQQRASDLADLRGSGGAPVRIVEEATGRLLGTVDAGAAHEAVHPGAIYVHQGLEHLVISLDDADAVAIVRPVEVDHSTHARTVSDVAIVETKAEVWWGRAQVARGMVDVTSQVVGFDRRRKRTGERLGAEELDLTPRTLRTAATWWTLPTSVWQDAGVSSADAPGAAHAAEHAAIGLLPLLATCDRWDLGGLSTVLHADTEQLTVFVHDAVAGGAGFAERGFDQAARWWRMTREHIAQCACASGCPACIQSPKCGNGNEPLDKAGAIVLLDALLAQAPHP
jgi:DEAD/DEAH box helicase domain-containing protein